MEQLSSCRGAAMTGWPHCSFTSPCYPLRSSSLSYIHVLRDIRPSMAKKKARKQVPGFTNLAPPAGLDHFIGSEMGRTKCARRGQPRDGLEPPASRVRVQLKGKKKPGCKVQAFNNLAPPAGLEPATYGLTVRCSTN